MLIRVPAKNDLDLLAGTQIRLSILNLSLHCACSGTLPLHVDHEHPSEDSWDVLFDMPPGPDADNRSERIST